MFLESLQKKLNEISAQIKKGVTPQPVSAREILSWSGFSRRGSSVNWYIKQALDKAGLETQPEFDWVYIDGSIKFVAIGSEEDRKAISTINRIGGLESANRKPLSVKPDSTISEAITKMMGNNFSQLPVMTNDRDVKGVITWKSISSKFALGITCTAVRECVDQAQVISAETSLFDAITIIAKHDYVLVQAQDRTICGIVTSSDLSFQFKELAEPFLLIGECEYILRRLVHGKFTLDELKNAKNQNDSSREITGVADLTLGEYIKLIENSDNWSKLKLAVDRKLFIENLNKVREIRNVAMHFDPEGVESESMQILRDFASLLRQLWRLGAI